MKKIILIILLFTISSCKKTTDYEQKADLYYNTPLGHTISINKGLNRLSLIGEEEGYIKAITYQKEKITATYNINLTKEQFMYFGSVIEKVLENRSMNANNNISGYDIRFTVINGRDYISTQYSAVKDFKNDLSADFYNLMLFLSKNKIVKDFLKNEKI